MGKGKNRKNRDSDASSNGKQPRSLQKDVETTTTPTARRSVYQYGKSGRQGVFWVIRAVISGVLFGFGLGSGYLTGNANPPNAWRVALGMKLRETQWLSGEDSSNFRTTTSLSRNHHSDRDFRSQPVVPMDPYVYRADPSHSTVYAVLREAIIREKGGYVHPDLGFLTPAPCGAARGLGMVRNSYHQCQTKCFPGVAKEKLANRVNGTVAEKYLQEEVLIKVPLAFQMTRSVALETLLPRISPEAQRKVNLHELDDAALLTLLLAHERGVGKYSRWIPYIASLPLEPSCGYLERLRPYFLDSINALKEEIGLDVNGWNDELNKAAHYAEKIASSLARDYGPFIHHPQGMSTVVNLQWALCQVASRGIGGSQKHGALRLIPMMDLINHDADAGGYVELTGRERLENGDFVDALLEDDSGAFVVRSLRHGRRKALREGQELLVNYNVPHYSPLDWFVSSGFVPPERWSKWQKMDAALPKMRRDGPFAEEYSRSTWTGNSHSNN